MSVIWVLSISKYSRPMNKYISICVNEPTNISSTQMNGHTKYYLPKAIPTWSADFYQIKWVETHMVTKYTVIIRK